MSDGRAERVDRFQGLLVGTAVGDALGLPMEGLSPRRARKMFGSVDRYRFLPDKGMVSDDTEHSIFVAQSLIVSGTSAEAFAHRLSWCLRWWLTGLPAGVGFATLRAVLKVWAGFGPGKSGVHSAGNGAAMRAAPIGAFFADDAERLDAFVTASTRITHVDPRAETAALAVARLAALAIRSAPEARPPADELVGLLLACGNDEEWRDKIDKVATAIRDEVSVDAFAASLGLGDGVTGYAYHTVPVVAFAWFVHYGDFHAAVTSVIECGGDADTTGAIVGALSGASVGLSGIPRDWVDGIVEWPRSVRFIKEVGAALARVSLAKRSERPIRVFWPGVVPRNVLFLAVVLMHGFRRMFPPY